MATGPASRRNLQGAGFHCETPLSSHRRNGIARLLTACWQAERSPNITVLSSDSWLNKMHQLTTWSCRPVRDGKITSVLRSLDPATAVILCVPADSREFGQLRTKYPRLVQSLRKIGATLLLWRRSYAERKLCRPHGKRSGTPQNENHATLGRYMLDMKHSVNNALTSMLGNAELLLLEPGQLSSQSLAQIKTMHSMALRINEVMQRFSSLASEMRRLRMHLKLRRKRHNANSAPS